MSKWQWEISLWLHKSLLFHKSVEAESLVRQLSTRNKLDQTKTTAAALPTVKCGWLASYESTTWAAYTQGSWIGALMKVPQNAACAFAFTLHTSRAGTLLCLCGITHSEPALHHYLRSSDARWRRHRQRVCVWQRFGEQQFQNNYGGWLDCWAWAVFLAVFNTVNSSKLFYLNG